MTTRERIDRMIPASDGFELSATMYGSGDDVVMVNAATAVPRRFYEAFATFLATHGYTVVTYDYRGIGGSGPDSLRGFQASASDWGLRDMQGVLDWVVAELNPTNLFAVGHSMGGQQAGMLVNSERIAAMVTVSAQSGYWRLQGPGEVRKAFLSVYAVIPLMSRLFGYFPWSRFSSGEDLPKDVALEWARWCRDSKYILGDNSLPLDRYATFRSPVLAYSIDDDGWGTERSVRAMMSAYPNVEFRHLIPTDFGLASLGHFGFFRASSQPLWEETMGWLRSYRE